jgi:hypothetical protein
MVKSRVRGQEFENDDENLDSIEGKFVDRGKNIVFFFQEGLHSLLLVQSV